MPATSKINVLSLDVWGNEEDGYEVNNQFRTGIDLLADMDDAYYYRQLREYFEWLPPFEIKWDAENSGQVIDRHNGKPIFELRQC